MRRYRIERVYPHPQSKVWRALTTSDLLARWLMPNDFEAIVGHEFQLTTEPGPGFDGIVHCQVLAMEAPHSMQWSWKGGPIDTVITFSLVAIDGDASTRLIVDHTGFQGFKGKLVGRILKLGSRKIYGKNLRQVLAEEASFETAKQGNQSIHPPSQTQDEDCMNPFQRALRGILSIFTKRPPESPNSPENSNSTEHPS